MPIRRYLISFVVLVLVASLGGGSIMGSPAAPNGHYVDIWTGAGWEDITDDTLNRDPIGISRGIPDEGIKADPTKCTLSLLNSASKINGVVGRYTDTNPVSDLYGKIGNNTPLRVVRPVAHDDFDRTGALGVSSSGHTWVTAGGDPADYAAAAGVATIDIDAVVSARVATIDVDEADDEILVTVKPGVLATGGNIQIEAVLRYQDAGNYYRAAVVFGTAGQMTLVLAARKASVSVPLQQVTLPGTYTAATEITIRAKVAGYIPILAAKAWDAAGPEPLLWQVRVADGSDTAITAAGGSGVAALLGVGNTNTLPVQVSMRDLEVVHHRCNGEVTAWPPRWDLSDNDVWMPIEAAGILRRLGATTAAMSPLRRSMPSLAPAAYWSLEDGPNSTQAGSGLPGGTPMVLSGTVAWATIDTIAGARAVPDMLRSTGKLVGSVPPPAAATGQWAVAGVVSMNAVTPSYPLLTWRVTGSLYQTYELRAVNDESMELLAYDGAGAATLIVSVAADGLFDGPVVVGVVAEESAGDTFYNVYMGSASLGGDTAVGVAAGQLAEIELTAREESDTETAAISHVAGWHTVLDLIVTGFDRIAAGIAAFPGESVSARLARLFAEENIAFIAIGRVDDSLMAPQRTAGILELADDAIAVGKGLLYEARDELGLIYLNLSGRYNRPVTLALDYTAAGHVPDGLEPLPDDQSAVNILTVTRRGGASATYEKTTGRRSTQPPPAGSGRYPQEVTLELANDDQPAHHAAWTVTAATWDEARYPEVPLDPEAAAVNTAAAVVEGIKRLDIGDRLTITSTPAWLPPADIDQHVLHLQETITAERWKVTPQTTAAGPYTVGQLGDTGNPGAWLQTGAGTKLATALAAGQTSALVHCDGPVFSTDPAALAASPLTLIAGGEPLSVSSIGMELLDPMNRVTSGNWGTAPNGQPWEHFNGAGSDYNTFGSFAQISNGTVNALRTSRIEIGSLDCELTVKTIINFNPLGASINRWLFARAIDNLNYYAARLQVTTSGIASLIIQKRVGGTLSSLGTSLTLGAHSGSSQWSIGLKVEGSTIKAKAWPSTKAPPDWQREVTDTSLPTGTKGGVLVRLEPDNTNTLPLISSWDDFNVTNLQRLTVERTLPITHPANEIVQIRRPLVLAL